GETGVVVNGSSPDDFARAITGLLRDSAFRSRLGTGARAYTGAHRWEDATNSTEASLIRASRQRDPVIPGTASKYAATEVVAVAPRAGVVR
ncbi:MAG: hypothetical protein EBT09_13330, partial [Actinobacteria bacterium]|nr:hypothetical protein [Actinomycetota bacterium]